MAYLNMVKKISKYWLKGSNSGQNMLEYILVFVGVVAVLIFALGPGGVFNSQVDRSMDEAVRGTKCMALEVCYDPDGCAPIIGNDCCERSTGETDASRDCCTPRTRSSCTESECGMTVSDGCTGTVTCPRC